MISNVEGMDGEVLLLVLGRLERGFEGQLGEILIEGGNHVLNNRIRRAGGEPLPLAGPDPIRYLVGTKVGINV